MLSKIKQALSYNRKPLIAISFDYQGWILEKFAKHIKMLNDDKYDFLLFSVHHLRKEPLYFKELFKYVDLILNMLPSVLLDISALTDKPIINTIHHWVDDDFIRPFIVNSKYIVTVSNEWKNKIVKDFNFDPNSVSMIHCGIERRLLEEATPLYPKLENKKTLGFFAKNTSNENDRKGIRHFKNFIYYLKEHNLLSEFRFIISGAGWDSFVCQIKEFGADVIYQEYTPEDCMVKLYKSLDFYLMLSDIEGGPATVVESMATKVVVIANNIGLVKDIGIDNENIIIVNNCDAEEIYQKISECSQLTRQNIINNAYNLAKQMTYENLFIAYSPIFERFLADYPRGGITALNLKKTQNFLTKKAPFTVKGKQ